jgi:hypothetical protein
MTSRSGSKQAGSSFLRASGAVGWVLSPGLLLTVLDQLSKMALGRRIGLVDPHLDFTPFGILLMFSLFLLAWIPLQFGALLILTAARRPPAMRYWVQFVILTLCALSVWVLPRYLAWWPNW